MDKHWKTLELPKILEQVAAHASFSAGRERILALRPTSSLREAQWWQQETTEARALLDARGVVSLGGAHDVRPLVERAGRGLVLLPAELLDIQSTLDAGARLRRMLARLWDQFPRLADRASSIIECTDLVREIERCINDRAEILDSASPELARIRREKAIAHQRLMDRLQGMISSSQYAAFLQELYVTERSGRFVIPVKAEFKGRIPGLIHDQSASGATLFIEPLAAVDLNNNWRQLQLDEDHETQRILAALSAQVAEEGDRIGCTLEALAYLDMTFAKALYAEETNSTEPHLVDWQPAARQDRADAHPRSPTSASQIAAPPHPGSVLQLIQARHPLLPPSNVVPIDVFLDQDYYILVITGPNTGGKTVSLKTVGLLCLMAEAGLHIPAGDGSAMSVFEKTYADIGDEQSIEQSLSTFSSHMSRIISILAEADSRSLVLLDELGAGTDPAEGSALARALLDYLRHHRITTLVATHYTELKAYAQNTPGVRNASVQFDLETLAPTFELRIGLPGQSNALSIAQRLGLSQDIIDTARQWLSPQELEAERLLQQIREAREAVGAELGDAVTARTEAEALRQEFESRLEGIAAERQEALRAAHAEAEGLLAELRAEIAEQRTRPSEARLEPAEAILEALAERLAPVEEAAPIEVAFAPDGLHPGDIVWVASLSKEGRLLSLEGSQAEVQLGQLRVKADLQELQFRQRPEPKPGVELGPVSVGAVRASPGLELEVRGWRIEDALERADKYLDEAYLARLPFVRIIHGKGTGRMRQAIRELLAGHPQVSDYRPGDQYEGGEGVTVVRLLEH